jgi:hypothetical protein
MQMFERQDENFTPVCFLAPLAVGGVSFVGGGDTS